MWAVFKAYSWSSLQVLGLDLTAPPDGPCKFIPLFDTKDQALKFADGDESNVFEMEEVKNNGLHTD